MNRDNKPTAAERARMGAVKRTGCRACEQNLRLGLQQVDGQAIECHHLVKTVRLGHDQTIALCSYHHRGILPKGHTTSSATAAFGPSLAKGSKPFHARYGSDAQLLKTQNERLGLAPHKTSANAGFAPRMRADRKTTPRPSKLLPPRAATWKSK